MNWQSKSVSEVAKERIWREYVASEGQHLHVFDTFRKHPKQLSKQQAIAESPTRRLPRFLDRQASFLECIERRVQSTQDELDAVSPAASPDRLSDLDSARAASPAENANGRQKLAPLGVSPSPARDVDVEFSERRRRLLDRPNRRQMKPLTETQALGWQTEPVAPAYYSYGKKSSELTRFATALATATAHQKPRA